PAAHVACGGGRRRHDSVPYDTATGVDGDRDGPALGAHTPRWLLRHPLPRHTSGRAAAGRGQGGPPLPSPGRWHPSPGSAGPVDWHAPRPTAEPPASPAPHCTRPLRGGARFDRATGGTLRPWYAQALPRGGAGLVAARPTLPVLGAPHRCVARGSPSPAPFPDPDLTSDDYTPCYPPRPRGRPAGPERGTPQSPPASPYCHSSSHPASRVAAAPRHRHSHPDSGAPV